MIPPAAAGRDGRKEIAPFASSGAAFGVSTTKERLAEAGEAGRFDRSAELQRSKVLEPRTQSPSMPSWKEGRNVGPIRSKSQVPDHNLG